jgi:hypothetical protein
MHAHMHTHAQATSQARHEIERSLTEVQAHRETLADDLEALDVRLVNQNISICIYMYMYMYVCMYVYIDICMYTCLVS